MRSRADEKTSAMRHQSQKGGIATGAMLLALIPTCPICNKSIKGHVFAQMASAIASENQKSKLAVLFSSVKHHEWGRLEGFNEWDALADNLRVHIIKGDHPDGIVSVIRDVFELYASNELILLERVTEADMAAIAGQLSAEWQQI